MVDCGDCVTGVTLCVSFFWFMAGWELEVDFGLSQDLYLVHVYHDV